MGAISACCTFVCLPDRNRLLTKCASGAVGFRGQVTVYFIALHHIRQTLLLPHVTSVASGFGALLAVQQLFDFVHL